MKRSAFAPLLLLPVLFACAPSNTCRRTDGYLKSEPLLRAEVAGLADDVAAEFGLMLDDENRASNTRGYLGPSFHYYRLITLDLPDGRLFVSYRHEGRFLNRKPPGQGPEDRFYSALRERFSSRVIEINPPEYVICNK